MWTLPLTDATSEMPFDPADSWWLGDQRTTALLLAGLVGDELARVVRGHLTRRLRPGRGRPS